MADATVMMWLEDLKNLESRAQLWLWSTIQKHRPFTFHVRKRKRVSTNLVINCNKSPRKSICQKVITIHNINGIFNKWEHYLMMFVEGIKYNINYIYISAKSKNTLL